MEGWLGRTQIKVTIEPAVSTTAGFCLALLVQRECASLAISAQCAQHFSFQVAFLPSLAMLPLAVGLSTRISPNFLVRLAP